MPLVKARGNMYNWIDYTHCHLGGQCPHECSYCYVDHFPYGRPEKYKGELRLIEKEFSVDYGSGKTIFIENCNDLFAEKVPNSFIKRIMAHCCLWPDNTYVFQTKNPKRFIDYIDYMPNSVILLTTIETNRDTQSICNAPETEKRFQEMVKLRERIQTL